MSEKELGQKWDRCLADCAIKVGKRVSCNHNKLACLAPANDG